MIPRKTRAGEPILTRKQTLFRTEYLVDHNATRAAIAAGYSPKSATAIAYENLQKPYMKDAVQLEIEARTVRTHIDQDYVVQHLVDNIKACEESEPRQAAAINQALALLARHTGGFSDDHKITIERAKVIEVVRSYELPEGKRDEVLLLTGEAENEAEGIAEVESPYQIR